MLLGERNELPPDRGSSLFAKRMQPVSQPIEDRFCRLLPRESLVSEIQHERELGRPLPQFAGVDRIVRRRAMPLDQLGRYQAVLVDIQFRHDLASPLVNPPATIDRERVMPNSLIKV
jgi:hypothetical protein